MCTCEINKYINLNINIYIIQAHPHVLKSCDEALDYMPLLGLENQQHGQREISMGFKRNGAAGSSSRWPAQGVGG